jgi:hypothetical protein
MAILVPVNRNWGILTSLISGWILYGVGIFRVKPFELSPPSALFDLSPLPRPFSPGAKSINDLSIRVKPLFEVN